MHFGKTVDGTNCHFEKGDDNTVHLIVQTMGEVNTYKFTPSESIDLIRSYTTAVDVPVMPLTLADAIMENFNDAKPAS